MPHRIQTLTRLASARAHARTHTHMPALVRPPAPALKQQTRRLCREYTEIRALPSAFEYYPQEYFSLSPSLPPSPTYCIPSLSLPFSFSPSPPLPPSPPASLSPSLFPSLPLSLPPALLLSLCSGPRLARSHALSQQCGIPVMFLRMKACGIAVGIADPTNLRTSVPTEHSENAPHTGCAAGCCDDVCV